MSSSRWLLLILYFAVSTNSSPESYFPKLSDVRVYLDSIEKVVIFAAANIREVDINFAFGLFLTNVNFKSTIDYYYTPLFIKAKLRTIVAKIDDLLLRFRLKIDNLYTTEARIFRYFFDDLVWIPNLFYLYNKTQEKRTFEDLVKIYSEWESYEEEINKFSYWIPSPKESETCLMSLAINPVGSTGFLGMSMSQCRLDKTCYSILHSGTNFGYALCHRILLIIMARYGRVCYYYSRKVDNLFVSDYCKMAYGEADYIFRYGCRNPDMMLEIMCFCSLFGQAEFLKRDWLQKILTFQTPEGCFNFEKQSRFRTDTYEQTWYGSTLRRDTRNGSDESPCNSHVTGLASATLAIAVRFISMNTS